jgi:hypothetical protein
MKVKKVKIKDFLVLKNFEADVNGKNILLLADNGRGKSSFMRFIEIAFGKQTEIPIGAEGEGTVVADKDGRDWTFQVKFKNGKPVVTVTSPEGVSDSKKSTLAQIVGSIDFDIDEFVNLSESTSGRKKQVEIYKGFLPQETQQFISTQEQRVKNSFDRRTELNREAKALQGYILEHRFAKYVETLPKEPIDTASLQTQIDESMKANEKVKEVTMRMENSAKEISDCEATIKELQAKIDELKKSQLLARDFIAKNPMVDVSDLMSEKDHAYAINSAFEDKQDYDIKVAQMELIKDEVGELTAFIESSRQTIEDVIKDCDIPVEGLSFDDDGLIYNGVPVSIGNLSTSEIMELGYKLKVAENPNFGIMFITRGESLGAQRLKDIQEMAKKNNLQIIMEQVERGTEQLTIEIMAD